MRIEDMLKVGGPSVSNMLSLIAVAALLGMTGCGGGGSDSGTSPSSASAPASAPSGSQSAPTASAEAPAESAPTASAEAPAESAPEAPAGSGGTGTTTVVNLPGGTPNLTPIVPVFTPLTDAEVNEIRTRDEQAIKGTYNFETGDPNAQPVGHISVDQISGSVTINLGIVDRIQPVDDAISYSLRSLHFPGSNSSKTFEGLSWTFSNSASYDLPGHRNNGANFQVQGRFITGGTPRIQGTITITNAAQGFEIVKDSGSSQIPFEAVCYRLCGTVR